MSGAAGSNACPAGSVRIETADACRTAVAAAGKTVGSPFGQTNPYTPRGCFYLTNIAFFNGHAAGAGTSAARLLCAATLTTGAPLHAPMRRRARAARYARAVCLIIQVALI